MREREQREQREAQVRQNGVGHADFRRAGRHDAQPGLRAEQQQRQKADRFQPPLRIRQQQPGHRDQRQAADRFAQMTVHAQPRDPRGGSRAGAAGQRAHQQQDQGADSQRGRRRYKIGLASWNERCPKPLGCPENGK